MSIYRTSGYLYNVAVPSSSFVLSYSPALWLDASDASTLVMDGARTFASASSQYLRVASNSTLQNSSNGLALGLWIKTTSGSDIPYVGKCSSALGSCDYYISGALGGAVLFRVRDTALSFFTTTSATVVNNNTWHFILAYHDPTEQKIKISVDGGAYTAGTTVTNPLITSTASFNVGSWSDTNGNLNGTVDSVVLLKPPAGWLASNATALRDYLYNGGSGRRSSDFMASAYYTGGNPSGAVSWWDMDGRSGNETDRIGSNNLTDNGGVGYAAGVASGLVQYTGDPVKQWSDKSGNARHLIAPSDAARPTYTTGSQNGLAGLTTDGINDVLGCTNFVKNATAVTIYMVGKRTSGFPGVVAGYNSSISGGGYVYYANDTTSGIDARPLISGTYGSYKNSRATSITASSANVLCGIYSAATGLQFFHNNTAATPDVFASTNFGGSNFFLVGCVTASTANGSDFGAGVFYEVAVFLEEHDATKRNNMIRYLGNKWGITVA